MNCLLQTVKREALKLQNSSAEPFLNKRLCSFVTDKAFVWKLPRAPWDSQRLNLGVRTPSWNSMSYHLKLPAFVVAISAARDLGHPSPSGMVPASLCTTLLSPRIPPTIIRFAKDLQVEVLLLWMWWELFYTHQLLHVTSSEELWLTASVAF